MTYPDPQFTSALDALVAPIRINIADRHEDFRDAAVMTKIPFSPRFRLFSSDMKRLLREWTGWMPAAELVAEFYIARGVDLLERKDPSGAVEQFDAALAVAEGGPATAEILYRRGMAAFIAGKFDWQPLRRDWNRVVEDHPGSRWASHASVIEDAPQ